jgi:NAD(P)-dependent dehydrogenase (short-subunit alcohol dehydrogenase family)
MKRKPIGEQVAVVMGASTGIGRLTALELARRGARVVVAARNEDALRSLVQQIEREGGQAVAVTADISVPEQVQAVADTALERFGGLDTWVNMAATSVYATFEQTTPEEFQRILAVNLLGYVYGMQSALPLLRKRGQGSIVNVSSVEEEVSMPLHSAYAASKHGIGGVADALRLELKHEGVPISVTSIKPASINTPFFDHARTKLGVKPRGMAPVYEPEEVVGAILYAAVNPIREIVVGGAGRGLIALRRLFPALQESLLARVGWSGQRTSEPRSATASQGLLFPVPHDHRIKQEADAPIGPIREPAFLAVHPGVGVAAGLAAAVLLVAGLSRWAGKRH